MKNILIAALAIAAVSTGAWAGEVRWECDRIQNQLIKQSELSECRAAGLNSLKNAGCTLDEDSIKWDALGDGILFFVQYTATSDNCTSAEWVHSKKEFSEHKMVFVNTCPDKYSLKQLELTGNIAVDFNGFGVHSVCMKN